MLILLSILILLVVLLAVPLDLEFDARWPESQQNRMRLNWAFGMVRLRLGDSSSGSAVIPGNDRAPVDPEPESSANPENRRGELSLWRAFRVADFRRRLWRFLGDLWRALHKVDLCIRCRVGLETPADTGLAWSVLGPVAGFLQTLPNAAIELNPEFGDEVVDVTGQGTLRIYPLQVLALFIGLLLSPSLWRGISAMRASR